jgi:hypothetical protein
MAQALLYEGVKIQLSSFSSSAVHESHWREILRMGGR